jgi:glycosyltransferase involved in cell wall biosynthesis
MRIVIIRKDALALIPPLLSVANIMADLGHQVHIITSEVSEQISKNLESKGITYQMLNFTGNSSTLGKIRQYLQFRYAVRKVLAKLDFDLLWVEDAHTLLSLGTFIKRYKYVLQISELYNNDSRLMKAISKVIYDAQLVFMPEYNRCVMYQVWFKLKRRPILLPNKPYFVPSMSEIEAIRPRYSKYLVKIGLKKIILYQGLIHIQRNIEEFVKAAARLGDDYIFVVMGRDQCGLVDKYRELNPNLLHIDFITAPDYLAITSVAYIGILSYEPMLLNTAYCAPNKIYEYGAFSIPMVGNDIPGLKILEQYKAGILVEENNEDAIFSAYRKINENHDIYSSNAKVIYDETDNKETIRKALSLL